MAVTASPEHEIASEEAKKRIRELAESSASHAALNNSFYELWQARALSADQVELVGVNFYERIARSVDRIAWAALRMTDAGARAETVENLNDELGHGDPARSHAPMVRRFFELLVSRMRGQPVRFEKFTAPVLPATHELNNLGMELFSSVYPEQAAGALLGQEWHACVQPVYLYEGARNYLNYFRGLDEFHENCEYFYLHIGSAEKEHKIRLISAVARMCRTTEQLERLKYGFNAYLALLAAQWAELYLALQEADPREH